MIAPAHGSNRQRLPETRASAPHHGELLGQDFYVIVGFYPGAGPGEVFVKIAKQGSDIKGWVDAWATTTSIALQYGVPWPVLREKALKTRFGIGDPEKGIPSLLHAVAMVVDLLVELNDARISGAVVGKIGAGS